ncbi:MAG: glucan biosynthesis protein G [Verrucomicrobiota bacterium]
MRTLPLLKQILIVAIGCTSALAQEHHHFERVVDLARERAAVAYQAPASLPNVLAELNYDQYRAIDTADDAILWADQASKFRIELLHLGYLFKKPVQVHIVDPEGSARLIPFTKDRFEYSRLVVHESIEESAIGGYAGFRLRYPLNGGPSDFDEIGSFIGASYFRLLGKDQRYGLSARGLALDTVLPDATEEFPDFVAYWLHQPQPDADVLEIHALLDSPSVAGAFRFLIEPGLSTVAKIDVTLCFRSARQSVGLAPLTSMYWFGENHKERPFLDWRPEVHDSDGLLIETPIETQWRPLYNHHAIRNAWFSAPEMAGFGLFQRDRDFESYQDLSNPYWLTPTAWISPLGDWPAGDVRLIELPTNNEAMDNVVCYFQPSDLPKAGDEISYSYELGWKMEDEVSLSPNRAISTRLGEIVGFPDTRRFVIDFIGPDLEALPADAPIFAEITSSTNGYVTENQCFKNVKTEGWRVEFKLDTDDDNVQPVELRCFLKDPVTGNRLSETWTYQWSP